MMTVEILRVLAVFAAAVSLGATIAMTAIERRERRRLRDAQRRLDEIRQRMTNQ